MVARSLGTLIATRARDGFAFRPRRAILIGLPLERRARNDCRVLFDLTAAVPTLLIKPCADFNGACAELQRAASGFGDVRLAEVPGDDRACRDVDGLLAIRRPFLRA